MSFTPIEQNPTGKTYILITAQTGEAKETKLPKSTNVAAITHKKMKRKMTVTQRRTSCHNLKIQHPPPDKTGPNVTKTSNLALGL